METGSLWVVGFWFLSSWWLCGEPGLRHENQMTFLLVRRPRPATPFWLGPRMRRPLRLNAIQLTRFFASNLNEFPSNRCQHDRVDGSSEEAELREPA